MSIQKWEVPHLLPDVGDGNLRPADALLRGVEGRTIAVDVTIVNTLQQQSLERASVTSGAACGDREALKIAKYRVIATVTTWTLSHSPSKRMASLVLMVEE